MNTSSMMSGALVIGAVTQQYDTPHLGRYITQPVTERKTRETVPVRISVKKRK